MDSVRLGMMGVSLFGITYEWCDPVHIDGMFPSQRCARLALLTQSDLHSSNACRLDSV